MANPLLYKRQAVRQADWTHIQVDPNAWAAPWRGVEKAAISIFNTSKQLGALYAHVQELEDQNALHRASAQLEIDMGESIVEIKENGPDPELYADDVTTTFDELSSQSLSSTKFHSRRFQQAYETKIAEMRAAYTVNAQKEGFDMRVKRGVAEVHDNIALAVKAASMNPDHARAKEELIERLDPIIADGLDMGAFTADGAREARAKALRNTDWYFAQEQVKPYPELILELTKNEKALYEIYPDLLPEDITKLRNQAEAQIEINKKKKEEEDKEAQKGWDRKTFDLKERMYDENITPEERAQAKEEYVQHLRAGYDIGIPRSFIDNEHDNLLKKAKDPNYGLYGNIMMGVSTGDFTDPRLWWGKLGQGLSKEMCSALDTALTRYEKNHGQINQWDGIKAMIDRKFKKNKTKALQLTNTVSWIQQKAGWANNDPRLARVAQELIDNDRDIVVGEHGWPFGTDYESLRQELQEVRPWEGGKWNYMGQFDPRTPTATPEEIKAVDISLAEENKKRKAAGKPPLADSAKNRQLILHYLRLDNDRS